MCFAEGTYAPFPLSPVMFTSAKDEEMRSPLECTVTGGHNRRQIKIQSMLFFLKKKSPVYVIVKALMFYSIVAATCESPKPSLA